MYVFASNVWIFLGFFPVVGDPSPHTTASCVAGPDSLSRLRGANLPRRGSAAERYGVVLRWPAPLRPGGGGVEFRLGSRPTVLPPSWLVLECFFSNMSGTQSLQGLSIFAWFLINGTVQVTIT